MKTPDVEPWNKAWDDYFMGIAKAVSKNSHCLSHQFGGIAVDPDRCIISTGDNGPPRGYHHCDDLEFALDGNPHEIGVCPRKEVGYKSGEGLEHCPAAHAERNVLINAARHGASLKGCILYVTSMTPCRECAKEIVNSGIIKMVYATDYVYPETGITGRDILEKCGVKLELLKW